MSLMRCEGWTVCLENEWYEYGDSYVDFPDEDGDVKVSIGDSSIDIPAGIMAALSRSRMTAGEQRLGCAGSGESCLGYPYRVCSHDHVWIQWPALGPYTVCSFPTLEDECTADEVFDV